MIGLLLLIANKLHCLVDTNGGNVTNQGANNCVSGCSPASTFFSVLSRRSYLLNPLDFLNKR